MSRRHPPLTPVEVSVSGIMAGLAVASGLLGTVLPALSTIFVLAAIVPVALVAARHGSRVAASALAAAVLVSLAMGGTPAALHALETSVLGVIVGALLRRGAGRGLTLLAALVTGVAVAAVTGCLVWFFEGIRTLVIDTIRTMVIGWLRLIGHLPGTEALCRAGVVFTLRVLTLWWVWVPVSVFIGVVVTVLVAHWALGAVLARLAPVNVDDFLARAAEDDRPVAPLPVTLKDVTFRHPSAPASARDALTGVDLALGDGEFVVVTGPNGSGKSTLALLLAGATPTSGRVTRPGAVGLGRRGGTALLLQRSELQVLGDDVTEDVLWGLDPGAGAEARAELPGLLALVGLEGHEHTPTRHLSGGQLQRLALAGALIHHPRLLISDESTAMIDAAGRAEVMEVLERVARAGTTVVHITHDPSEAARADRLVRMEDGRITADAPSGPATPTPVATATTASATSSENVRLPLFPPLVPAPTPARAREHGKTHGSGRGPGPAPARAREHLWARGVTHVHDVGTPWETPVLRDLDLIVSPGQGVLITGGNGAGKTTLARILTGLLRPTWGHCTLGSDPVWRRVGDVAHSMQFARLQLLRPTVREDILHAAGLMRADATERARVLAQALDLVNLPRDIADQGIDALSGGQMRRVALAGMLAADPAMIVLDEPLAGLDEESRRILLEVLAARRAAGTGVLVISHDTEGMADLCEDRLCLVEGRLE